MHFSWASFGHLAAIVAPAILGGFGVPPALADVAGQLITEAELLPRATGAEKKQYVLVGTRATAAIINSVHPGTVDPSVVDVLDKGIDATVGAINLAHGMPAYVGEPGSL